MRHARLRGFSTLEMLIAMTVLVLAISAVTLLSPGSQSLGVDSQTDVEALNKAQGLLENEQALARKDFKLVVPTTTAEMLGGILYTESVAVTPANANDYFTRTVKATVSWPAMYGRSPNVSLTSNVTNFVSAVGGDTCYSMLTNSAGGSTDWAHPSATNLTLGSRVSDANGYYPVSGLDAYQKRLYVTVATSSSPVGPSAPQLTGQDTTFGTIAWTNAGNITSNDSVYATAGLSTGQSTNYIKATKFGFNIPQGSTILGIKVEIERKGSSSSITIKDARVRIIRGTDGAIGTTDEAHSTSWPTTEAFDTYGSASDYWGESSWTPTAINSPSFGVAIAATANTGSGSRTASIDFVRVTITYTKQLYILDISNPTNPVFLGGLATSTLGVSLNEIAVATSSAGNYAYALTDSSTGTNQLEVIDVTKPAASFVVANYPSASGSGVGTGVGTSLFYNNGYLYLGLTKASGPEFNIIDVHNPLSPVLLGTYSLGGVVNNIYVNNRYAYVSHLVGSAAEQLTILDISDPVHPTRVGGSANNPGVAATGKSLYGVGDTIYFGRTTSNPGSVDAIPDFYVFGLNSSNPAAVATTSLATYALPTSGDGVYDILVRDYLAFLLTGNSSSGNGLLRILNLKNFAAPAVYSTVTLPNNGGPVALDCEGNYLYAASVPVSGTPSLIGRGSISVITAP